MPSSPYVKFDRSGVPYVELADLKQDPKIQRQLKAANELIERLRVSRSPKPDASARPGSTAP